MTTVQVNFRTSAAIEEIKRHFGKTLVNVLDGIVMQSRVNITQNDQLDTGFMRASNYAKLDYHGNDYSTYDATWENGAYPSRRHPGTMKERQKSMEARVTAAGLAGTAANYAADQELQQSFLWQACEEVRQQGLIRYIVPL